MADEKFTREVQRQRLRRRVGGNAPRVKNPNDEKIVGVPKEIGGRRGPRPRSTRR